MAVDVCGTYEVNPVKLSSRFKALEMALLASLLVAPTPRLFALDPTKAITQHHQDVWGERDGLPQASVQAIVQTRDGYIWIGTRDGLARFDGVTFTVFRTEEHAGLGANDIRALFEDSQGRLWIGTFNGGLSCYHAGKFTHYDAAHGLPSNGVIDIAEAAGGELWLATWNGVTRFDGEKFDAFDRSRGLSARTCWSIAVDRGTNIWVGSIRGVHTLNASRFESRSGRGGIPHHAARKVFVSRDGTLWIGTIGAGLVRLREGAAKTFTVDDGLSDNKVRTIFEDSAGSLWVGTWSGLSRMRGERFETLGKSNGLPHDYVETLYEDREGSLWIGIRGGGLARLRDDKFSSFTTAEGLANNFVKCVAAAADGSLWIGMDGGGLNHYAAMQFARYSTEHGLLSHYVRSLAIDRSGELWVGTSRPCSIGVLRNGRFVSYTAEQGLPIEHGVRALYADRSGNLWIGGDTGGLCQFRDGKFTAFNTSHGLANELIRVITEDRSGNLWVGTEAGLSRFRDGKFTNFTTRDGLAHNAVYAIHEDAEGVLWFATQNGLSRFASGVFKSYTTRDGLPQNAVYQILEDDFDHLWISGNRGVFTVAKKAIADYDRGALARLPSVSYGVSDGMHTAQCEGGSQPAGSRSTDGRLWFATIDGVAVVNPNKIVRNLQPPPVFIESVVAGAELLDVSQPAQLGPGAGELRFHYTALSFAAPEKVRFKYKLEGLDNGWIDAGTRRVAFYNKVPAGTYRFRVIACNNDGVWNEAGASFALALAPRFYQTSWFFGAGTLVLALAAWSFHRTRMQRAKAQFSLVLAERNRIARELHDTLAQGFAGIAFQLEAVATRITDAPAQAQEHLKLALNMVRHSLAEARRSVLNLRSAALEAGDLASALGETARQMVADKPVEVAVDTLGEPRTLPAKIEQHLLRIGQEAITNAFKHSGAHRIQVELHYLADRVRLRVHDDGCGFENASAVQNGTHFGLRGIAERATQMGATLAVNTTLGRGTEISIEVSTATRTGVSM